MEEDGDLSPEGVRLTKIHCHFSAPPAEKVGKMAQDFWIFPAHCSEGGSRLISSVVPCKKPVQV